MLLRRWSQRGFGIWLRPERPHQSLEAEKRGNKTGFPHRSVETKRGCKIDFLTILRTPKKGLQKGFPYHSVEAEKEGGPGEVQYELQGVNAQGERLRPEPCQKGDSLMVNDEGFILTVTVPLYVTKTE